MKKISNDITVLVIKDSKMNSIPVSKQTTKMREKANNKIRELGEKYYNVKKLFDKKNYHRDVLFNYGKELEFQFKNQKKKIKLQSQTRRMKDLLICWYTENFYDVIFQPNSFIIEKLNFYQFQDSIKSLGLKKIYTSLLFNQNTNTQNENLQINEKNKSASLFTYVKINKEIDNVEFSNIGNDQQIINDEKLSNNFDFNKFLNF